MFSTYYGYKSRDLQREKREGGSKRHHKMIPLQLGNRKKLLEQQIKKEFKKVCMMHKYIYNLRLLLSNQRSTTCDHQLPSQTEQWVQNCCQTKQKKLRNLLHIRILRSVLHGSLQLRGHDNGWCRGILVVAVHFVLVSENCLRQQRSGRGGYATFVQVFLR